MQTKSDTGKVYIVGAGPGNPNLITLRALNILRKGDVILYDRLVNSFLLSYCKVGAQKICVGKQPTRHSFPQDEINRMLIEFARQGKTVVRLKGGDPFIFGRGSEEALALVENNIPFEIIPGVTSALGASAYSGIPLTHRNLATQVVFVTANEDPTKPTSQVDWNLLSKLQNATIVVYMGASTLPLLVENLIKNGCSPATPAAIIMNSTLPSQKCVRGELKDLPELVEKHSLSSPLLTIIGPTVEVSSNLDWFHQKPLFGRRFVTTRSIEQSSTFHEKLYEEGAEPIPFHVIDISPITPTPSISNLLSNKFDWIIFTSENGVRYFFELLFKEGKDIRAFGNVKVGAIGTSSANTLKNYGIIADFIPSSFTSQTFIAEFPAKYELAKSSILRVKGNFTNDPISENLSKLCKQLTTFDVYKIDKATRTPEEINEIVGSKPDGIIFTASTTVNYFFDILGIDTAKDFLAATKVFAIGPMTERALRAYEIGDVYVARKHTVDGIIELLKYVFQR
jgi:uroporphyrinogen III methyltransferase/synthase